MKVQTLSQIDENMTIYQWYMALSERPSHTFDWVLTLPQKKVKEMDYGTGKERQE